MLVLVHATMEGAKTAVGRDARDLAIAGALFIGVVIYLGSLPRSLGWADESFLLYESKRIRNGEVLYRDVFEFVAPAAWYFMALLYAVFGATIETARTTADVLHAWIAVAIYLACRRLEVGRGFAALAAAAHVALCQPVWPFTSPHWFATALSMLLLLVLLAAPWRTRPSWAILPGAVGGLLTAVQQQKGVYMVAAAALILLADRLLDRGPARQPLHALASRLLYFFAGAGVVAGAIFGFALALAGFDKFYEALVRYPLVNYRKGYQFHWAEVTPVTQAFAEQTVPFVLRWLPLALLAPLVATVRGLARDQPRGDRGIRDRIALIVAALGSIVSIYYAPDIVHVAFIACMLLVALGDACQQLLGAPSGSLVTGLRGLLLAGVAAGCVFQLQRVSVAAHAAFPAVYDSAFGRVALSHPGQGKFIDEVRRRLDSVPDRKLFCYRAAAVYLLAGASNPTRFQLFKPHINDQAQIDEVLSVLRREQLPYVVTTNAPRNPRDPIQRYLIENYEVVRLRSMVLALLRRKGLAEPE